MDNAEAKRLAASLRRIESEAMRAPRPGLKQLWYRGEEPYFDVFFELKETTEVLDWFQFTLRGRAITWQTGRLWTGDTHETEIGSNHPASKDIDEDAKLDREFAAEVVQILGERETEDHFQLARLMITAYLA